MNVIVTIPASRLDEVAAEERDMQRRLRMGETGLSYFWSLSRRPTRLRTGDFMYFVWRGAIRAYHVVTGFRDSLQCEFTGRQYSGSCVLLDPKIHYVEPIAMQGFRGYRYMTAPVRKADERSAT